MQRAVATVPQLVTVRHRRRDGRRRQLFLPVLPVLLLLSPLLVPTLLAGVVACLITRVSPVGALRGTGRLLWALPGTRIDIEDGRTATHVHINAELGRSGVPIDLAQLKPHSSKSSSTSSTTSSSTSTTRRQGAGVLRVTTRPARRKPQSRSGHQ